MSTELTPAMCRSALIALLRHPEDWPDGFEWNFDDCHSCAVGLAVKSIGLPYTALHFNDDWAEFFGCSRLQAQSVFAFSNDDGERSYPGYKQFADPLVSPTMVADCLEALHRELVATGR